MGRGPRPRHRLDYHRWRRSCVRLRSGAFALIHFARQLGIAGVGRSDDASTYTIFPERGLFVGLCDHLKRAGGGDVSLRKSGLQNLLGTSG